MKSFAIILILFSTLQIAAFAQLGEGTFLGQCNAGALATGGPMIDYSMSDSMGITLHVQRPYSLKDFDRLAVEAVLPLQPMRILAAYTQVGDDIMLEQAFLVFLGKRLTKSVHIHVGCGAYLVKTIQGSSGSSVYADLGVLYNLNTHISAGFRLVNPTGAHVTIEGVKKKLEQIGIVGLTVYPSRTFFLLLEGEKRPTQSPVTRVGFNYTLDHACIVLGGISFHPVQPAFGIGGQTGRISYNVGVRSHPQLGLTTAFSCSYAFHRKP